MTEPTENERKKKDPRGRKSLIEDYLHVNPAFKKSIEENDKKISSSEDNLASQPIATLEDLYLYMQFELERSRNADLLRGKTLTEYSREFIACFKAIQDAKYKEKLNEVELETQKRNREEVEEFMKFTIEAITKKIEDINLRKEISQEIKNQYDKTYPTESGTGNTTSTPGDSTEPTSV